MSLPLVFKDHRNGQSQILGGKMNEDRMTARNQIMMPKFLSIVLLGSANTL